MGQLIKGYDFEGILRGQGTQEGGWKECTGHECDMKQLVYIAYLTDVQNNGAIRELETIHSRPDILF